MEKLYQCICGKTFNNPQKFNGHKSHCKIHHEAKGTLDAYIAKQQHLLDRSVEETLKRSAKKRELQNERWISEKHTCEKCGALITEKYGSGRFCSKACANSRKHSEESRNKVSTSLKAKHVTSTNKLKAIEKYNTSPKYCKHCGIIIPYENRRQKYCSAGCRAHKEQPFIDKVKKPARYCPICNLEISQETPWRKFCSNECSRKGKSLIRKNLFAEGKIQHANVKGIYKYGTYKGFYCDSSWELAFIMFCLDNSIMICRNRTESFCYTYKGSNHRFFPDFKIGDKFVEIKGRKTGEVDSKIACIPNGISFEILYYKDMKFYISYAEEHYGKDFYTLYDRNYPSWLDKLDKEY